MRSRQPAPVRQRLAPSIKVALVTTLVVSVVYAGSVAFSTSSWRTGWWYRSSVSSRAGSTRSRAPAALATEEPDSPGGGVHYGLGIYGEPIYVWEVGPHGLVAEADADTPALPSLAWPAAGAGSVTRSLSGTDYRLLSVKYRGGLLVAGESLTELTHVESILTISELAAAPVLLIAIFLASLLIGLRSARPIELGGAGSSSSRPTRPTSCGRRSP